MQKYRDIVQDRNGNALVGISVLVQNYPALTIATIYSDNGVTPIANPLTTDAYGTFAFYAADGRYSLVISGTGINTTTLSDIPLLEDPADGNAALAGPNGASLVGFIQAGTGAVARTIQSKLRDVVSVRDFGAVGDGVADDTASFNSAAAIGTTVTVPKGTWKITVNTVGNVTWALQAGAYISGLPDINPGPGGGIMNDTSRLTGKVSHQTNLTGYTGFRFGASNPWLEKTVRPFTESISEAVVLSSSGQVALITASRASDNPTPNFACIGASSYAVNDNTSSPEPAWATYTEARRSAGAGAAYGCEADMVNLGSTFDLDPFTTINTVTGQTVQCWLTNGGGDVSLGGQPISAAVVVHPNPSTFKRAMVVRNGALDGTVNEVITMPNNYRALAWYSAIGVLRGFIGGAEAKQTSLSNTAASGVQHEYVRLRANGTDPTGSLDVVLRTNYTAFTGVGGYSAGFQQIIQRTAFGGGNARFSWDLQVAGDSGSTHQISLNGLGNNSFAPLTPIDFGNGSFAWGVGYFNGLRVKEGSNAKQGVATLVAGTVVVANTSVTANSRIFITSNVDGGTPGFLRVSARSAGVSFTITSSSGTDTSTVAYEIFEPG